MPEDKARILSIIVANITWNPSGWRNPYTNPKAGHKYARTYPGHESLNFKFDKKNLDTEQLIYGFIQGTNPPKKFKDGGVIIFYTRNLDTNNAEIVGIYCDVKIIDKKITPWNGFQNNELISNIKAQKDLSMLFPIPLDAKKYSKTKKRLVPQIGYTYKDINFAINIVEDEIKELSKSGMQSQELNRLNNIYHYLTGKRYYFNNSLISDPEQDELSLIIEQQDKNEIINELNSLKITDPEIIEIKHKTYKRDNKTIVQLKILRDFKCQLCGCSIIRKNKKPYIEAAHITPKSEKGVEKPDNILILCPNHHKEFDLGDKEIIEHTKERIQFKLNNVFCDINLKL